MPRAPARSDQSAKRVAFRTETGSVYEIWAEGDQMWWRRRSATLASGVLRTEDGRLEARPRVALGEPCLLVCEPLNPPHLRLVLTTAVVAVLEGGAADGGDEGARPRAAGSTKTSARAAVSPDGPDR
jgi:hypothetical protein